MMAKRNSHLDPWLAGLDFVGSRFSGVEGPPLGRPFSGDRVWLGLIDPCSDHRTWVADPQESQENDAKPNAMNRDFPELPSRWLRSLCQIRRFGC